MMTLYFLNLFYQESQPVQLLKDFRIPMEVRSNNNNNPLVSVIIPNYNHAEYLRNRIDSVLNQTFQDIEVILLDDYSADRSLEILREYSDHPKVSHIVANDANSGSTFRQWEKGIDLAIGDWVWIAESDDWCETTFLESVLEYIDGSTVISCCQ